jgi:hypothetical protein
LELKNLPWPAPEVFEKMDAKAKGMLQVICIITASLPPLVRHEKSPSLELKRASAAFPTTITTAATNQPVLIKCTQMH